MPIFDIRCEKCKYEQEAIMTACPDSYALNKECIICNTVTVHTVLPPLVSMQPDKYWSGQMTEAGYVTSGSFLKRFRKQNHLEKVDRSIYEEVQKKHNNRQRDTTEKNKKGTIKFLEKELADVEISPDGNTLKEKNNFIKTRE